MKVAPTGTILDPTIPTIDIPPDSGSGQGPKQTPGKPADAGGGQVGPGGGPGPTAPGGTAGEGVVSPSSGSLSSIIQATQRLNPCMELDVDVLAVTRADVLSTTSDWTTHAGVAGVLTNVTADTSTGTLRLTPTAPVSLFSQTASATVHHFLQDGVNGVEQYALDFFPDPTITQGVSFTLSSLDLDLRMGNLKGYLRVQVSYYDQSWRLVPMGDPIDILSGDIVASVGTSGGIYTIDFLARGHRYVFQGGFQNSITGDGFDGTNIRTSAPDSQKISHLNLPRGLSISIQPFGKNATDVWIGCVPNATATQFQTGSFWRVAANRNCGPYNPTNQPFTGNTTDHNPDNYLITGAVPNFGAKVVTNGQWGIARRIPTSQRAQGAGSWEQPYHNLKVVAYPSTGSAVNVLDMGATPVNPVQLRIDDWQEFGTSLSYVLKGSNTANTGPWTAITLPAPPGGPDGAELTGADLYRWYQLTTTFTPGPSGATKYATPALQAWSMVERVPLSTYRYLKDFDSTVIADPVTAQSSIGELTLPVMNVGRQDFRDLATSLGSNWAPSSLEAHVFARNTRTNVRYFLNSYRLENREPQFGVESMTFVSGMDRLSVTVPAAIETYRYPSSGQVSITNVTNVGAVYTITVGGTPFTIGALVGFRMHGVTGVSAGLDFAIASNPTTSQFTINVPNGAIPAIGDTIEIHSDVTTRVASPYLNQNFGVIYKDILSVQAQVPSRYRGQLPGDTNNKVYATDGVTERLASYTFDSAGVKALDVLQDVALHCGGFPTWDRGQIQFADFYGPKVSRATWDERHYVSLETPIGADRRMPSVKVKYGYQPDIQRFTNESTYEDFDTLVGWGRANLFDVFELPDKVCKWNDVTEAKFMADMLQKAWKSGVRLWKVKTVLDWPYLSQGDAITIMTDQYTDRRLAFSSDGLTDLGTPVFGRTAAIGVIVGKNLYGNEFIVGVRGLDAITSTAVATTGTRARQSTMPTPPGVEIAFDSTGQAILNSIGDAATVSQTFAVVASSTVPTDAAIRAGTTIASQSITGYATGVIVLPGQTVSVGVFAYNAASDESVHALVTTKREGASSATSDVLFVASSGITLGGNTAIKNTGTSLWDEQVYSKDGYTGGAFASAVAVDTSKAIIHGINTDPATDASYTSIDYAFYQTGTAAALQIYESGAFAGSFGTYAIGDVLAVTYDGSKIRYLQNGIVLRTVTVAGGIKFFFDSSFNSPGGSLSNIRFGPMSSNDAPSIGAGALVSGINESGGKAVNRLLGKALAADPDNLDGAPDGTTYKKVLNVSSGLNTQGSNSSRNRCGLKRSAFLSVTQNTNTPVGFDTEDFDVGTLHDTSTNNSHITIPTGGGGVPWLFGMVADWSNNSDTTRRKLALWKNGSLLIAGPLLAAVNGDSTTQTFFWMDVPADGDYYEMVVWHNAAAAVVLSIGSKFYCVSVW